ncbi:unnamed protein product [Prunus armeniaca]|uniref:Uncharacterized protein n=1 Tax=Prunus armeniaca TaxID=36596 RepID=A0A6J5WH29_PRUAR|nr:unnamed protein product [Prunus armeniaca]CAB4300819.1 unnamed protein product [Prunus armeniaca]
MSSSSNNNISLPFSIVDELAPVDFGIGFNNTGQDQPVAAYPNPSALESSNAQINEKLHKLLFKSLKKSVADSTSELKSQSIEPPKPTRRPIILTDAPASIAILFQVTGSNSGWSITRSQYSQSLLFYFELQEATRRSRGPTAPAGQLTGVRFKLPEAFDGDGLDVEKVYTALIYV